MMYEVKRRRMGVWVMWGIWDIKKNTWIDRTFINKTDAEQYIKTMN